MNIFILDEESHKIPPMMFDKHIVKMPLETAQILSSVFYQTELGFNLNDLGMIYKKTHYNHPCCVWARTSKINFIYLLSLGLQICDEYTYRYEKTHACKKILENINIEYKNIYFPNINMTDFALAMPDSFKSNNAVESYRNYYISKNHLAKWTKRNPPDWWPKDLDMNTEL